MSDYPAPAELLPHEDPILYIDKILDFIPNKYLIAEKFVYPDDPYFKGHFPGYPLLPGVILVEALFQSCSLFNRVEMMSQTNSILQKSTKKNDSGRAIKIDKFSFKEEIRPNTRLELKVELKYRIMNFSVFKCQIMANNKLAASGEITTYIQK